MEKDFARGLEGVIAAESGICSIDGEAGKLYYRGYSIEDIVGSCTFEEVVYLLLYEALPKKSELEEFSTRMRTFRGLKDPIRKMIHEFPSGAHPMELLQSVMSYLSGYVQHKIEHSMYCNCRDTLHQVSQMATSFIPTMSVAPCAKLWPRPTPMTPTRIVFLRAGFLAISRFSC